MLALLYDVHGNLPALDAVLDDAQAQGATEYLLGGDYALFGAWPRETVERLRALERAEWIRGNGERWCGDPAAAPEPVQEAVAACRDALGAALVEELSALPEGTTREGVRYVHASPVSDVRSFLPAAADEDEEMLAGASERRVVFGHTHLPFARTGPRGTELVNPGSVGMPFDGDTRAAYALVSPAGEVEHRRVGYDHAAVAATLRERYPGFGETIARRIEQGRFDAG